MLEHFKGNRSPSLTDTIRVDGSPFDLTGSTVKLKMRPERSSTLKVNTAATIVAPTLGTVRYDWAAIDVDTTGDFICWWEVTLPSAKVQETPEFILSIRDHATTDPTNYVEREDLKRTLSLTGMSFADADIDLAVSAASRAVERYTGRRFYPDLDANQVRFYTAAGRQWVPVDDMITLTGLVLDWDQDNVYEQDWTALTAQWMLEPRNAVADGVPFTAIRGRGSWEFPLGAGAVRVTGKFGWATAPVQVVEATGLVASRLLNRARSPVGLMGVGVDGEAARITNTDPDVDNLLCSFSRLMWAA